MTLSTAAKPISQKELRMFRGSFWLLILAETMTFVTLFSMRFLFSGTSQPAELNYVLGIILTVLFITSVFPFRRAVSAISQGNQQALVSNLMIAFFLGLLALIGIFYDWVTLGLVATDRYGGIYYLTTGFHVLHIVAGLVTLLALWSSARRGRFSPQNYWVVEAGALLWYFVVVTWLALFLIFYLI